MTLLLWLLRIAAVWLGLSLPVAVGIGRAIGRAEPAPEKPREWTDQAIREEFNAMAPGFVTDRMSALDGVLNRKARGGAR